MSFRVRKKSQRILPTEETDGDKVMDDIMNLEPITRNKIGNKYIYSSKKYDPSKHPDVKRERYLAEYRSSLLNNESITQNKEELFFDKKTNMWKLTEKTL